RNPPPSASAASAPAGGWEREVLEKVLMATVREQRAARRWRIFFRFVALGLIGVLIYAFASLEGETVSTG
ncbi:S49 family peptidase, partial [Escherichia coli]|nr:S49 family peptidase [Escherichia coli]